MNLGIGTHTYAWAIGIPGYHHDEKMSIFDLMEKAAIFGLSQVQIADNLPLHLYSTSELKDIRFFSKERSLNIEVGMRGLDLKRMENYLELAVLFGSPFLRVVIDSANYEPEIDEIIQIINELLPSFKKAGVILAIENHDRFKAHSLIEIIECTDSQWVGICLDPINSLGADQSINEILPILAPYTVNFHIKDYIIKRKPHNLGFNVTGTPAGTGVMPITRILHVLNKYGRCKSAILELWTEPLENTKDTIRKEALWAAESVYNLKKIFKSKIS